MIKRSTDVTCESANEFYHRECTINPSSEHHYAKHRAENDKSRNAYTIWRTFHYIELLERGRCCAKFSATMKSDELLLIMIIKPRFREEENASSIIIVLWQHFACHWVTVFRWILSWARSLSTKLNKVHWERLFGCQGWIIEIIIKIIKPCGWLILANRKHYRVAWFLQRQ